MMLSDKQKKSWDVYFAQHKKHAALFCKVYMVLTFLQDCQNLKEAMTSIVLHAKDSSDETKTKRAAKEKAKKIYNEHLDTCKKKLIAPSPYVVHIPVLAPVEIKATPPSCSTAVDSMDIEICLPLLSFASSPPKFTHTCVRGDLMMVYADKEEDKTQLSTDFLWLAVIDNIYSKSFTLQWYEYNNLNGKWILTSGKDTYERSTSGPTSLTVVACKFKLTTLGKVPKKIWQVVSANTLWTKKRSACEVEDLFTPKKR